MCHVAYSLAGTWATWAEVLEPVGATDQKSKMGMLIYPYKLSFLQIYKKFRDILASPNTYSAVL